MYVVKVIIGANCAQGGPEKGGILCPFNPFKPTRVVPLEQVGRDRRLEASEQFTSKKQTECLDYFYRDGARTNKVRGPR